MRRRARRVFGLAVYQGRVYYAVAAGLRIWSVSLLRDGSFGADARVEVTMPRGARPGIGNLRRFFLMTIR